MLQAKEENYRLLQRVEFVQEALIRYEGALGDECRPVDEIRALLKYTVPMLRGGITSKWYIRFFDNRKENLRQRCPHPWMYHINNLRR